MEQLRCYVERIERLEAEKAAVSANLAQVLEEIDAVGLDTGIIRHVVRLRRSRAERRTATLLDLYRHAVGISVHECWF